MTQLFSPVSVSSKAPCHGRRHFMGLLAFTTLSLVACDWLSPASVSADSNSVTEKGAYHIFISQAAAKSGAIQTVTFRTGKRADVRIPAHSVEGSKIIVKGCGVQGKDAVVVLHTLSDPSVNIDDKVEQIISFVEQAVLFRF